ncbi:MULTISPECIES: hypothetical protein [unclassified Streptomyces]|uniref:hypothetical protein n=1 Tax=unclassified Streptomyces TaxID=2593676 RepID=UPI00081DA779|nr:MULTISPECIES: hypothetical protein [unclassified Streptomyces]SCF64179.1 hypothetical protein GA0115259_100525 [Streptomyces sp. MnatMP-M17]
MNPTPETKTSEPETAEAPTTKATEAISDSASEAEGPTLLKADSQAGPDAAADGESDDPEGVHDLDDDEDLDDDDAAADERRPSGLGAAAASVLAVCLGIIALTGTWTGRVISEREALIGQITLGQSATPEQQISEGYGDAWHATAAANGVVALLALVIGAIVLLLPQRAGWVRPFAMAGAVLGLLGLLVSVGMYFDLFAALPAPPAPAPAPAG